MNATPGAAPVSAADCVAVLEAFVELARAATAYTGFMAHDDDEIVNLRDRIVDAESAIRALRQEGGWQHVVSITAECLEQAKSSHRTLPVVSARSPLRGDNWIPLYALTPSPKGPTT